MADAPMGIALQQIGRLFDEGTTAGLPDGQLLERFLARSDQTAFATLVRRHGPMVMSTCRAVLRDPNDAEDAFQATFLVLICKARSIRSCDALGTWLHRVTHRIALQAGSQAARRRTCERLASDLRDGNATRDELGDDTRQVLHEELARLSEKHRLPILLCDLEGKTHAQAAQELNCGEATVRRRLAGARDLLRSRLARRGLAPTIGGLVTVLGRSAGAAVPAAWVEATVRAASSLSSSSARIAMTDVVSTTAQALARKSLRIMFLSQLQAVAASTVFLIALVGLAWGVGMPGQEKAGSRDAPRMQDPRTVPVAPPVVAGVEKPADPQTIVTYRGRVLDPSGHPLPGARLYVVHRNLNQHANTPVRATSDASGRFRFSVPGSDFDSSYMDTPWSFATILAQADGYAFGVTNDLGNGQELTLKAARDDVPISGRIIDMEGHPVAGVTVTVVEVRIPVGESLDDWLKLVEERKDSGRNGYPELVNPMVELPSPTAIAPVRTGPDGTFRIEGAGRDRIVTLQVEGPTIETKQIEVLARPGKTVRFPRSPNRRDDEPVTIYGATFEHVAAPTRPIEGMVFDLDTGKPLVGILVHSERTMSNRGGNWRVQTMTDDRGHYRLAGLSRGRAGNLVAIPPVDIPDLVLRKAGAKVPRPEDLPYLRARVAVPESRPDPVLRVDIRLKRGVWVTGRVLDSSTGKPVRAQVEYFAYNDNPYLKVSPGFTWSRNDPISTGKDRTFHIVAFPGPGVLAASLSPGERGRSTYVMEAGLDRFKHERDDRILPTQPSLAATTNYHVLAEIDPAPGTLSLTCDLVLETGRSLSLTLLDPDGKPIKGPRIAGLNASGDYWGATPSDVSVHTITGLKPGKKRLLSFLDEKQQLVGELMLNGDETTPRSITLQPWGTLTGRVVDEDGEPLGEGSLYHGVRFASGYPRVGKDGRFRVERLVPGTSYTFDLLLESGRRFRGTLLKDLKVGPGEMKDVGDVVPKPRSNK